MKRFPLFDLAAILVGSILSSAGLALVVAGSMPVSAIVCLVLGVPLAAWGLWENHRSHTFR